MSQHLPHSKHPLKLTNTTEHSTKSAVTNTKKGEPKLSFFASFSGATPHQIKDMPGAADFESWWIAVFPEPVQQ